MKRVLNPIRLCVAMLTRVPTGTFEPTDGDWRWASACFPLAGYVVGAVCALPAFALVAANSLDAGVFRCGAGRDTTSMLLTSSVLLVALSAWMTRMFHLDGFSDVCDAFSAMTDSPEKRLEIMKDPHPGAAAMCATTILLIVKTSFVFLLFSRHRHAFASLESLTLNLLPAVIAVPAGARFAMTLLAWIGKYPRDKGTGKKVVEETGAASAVVAGLFLLPLAFFLSPPAMAAIFAAAVVTALYWKRKADKLLGGITGDVLGACCETAECAILLVLLL